MTTENALTHLMPEVRTLARPTSGALLSARAIVQRDPDLQAAFVQAKADGWDAERLARHVTPMLEAFMEAGDDARQAALYLADEYVQGGDGILILSRQTGKALARITEDDVWQPGPTRREDGSLVKPLPRLRPELEGFLVQWTFDRSREQDFLSSLTPSQAGTTTAKALTHEGRKGIVERLRANADQLLASVKGNVLGFLESFDPWEDDRTPEWLTPLPRTTAFARTSMALSDFKATNLRFDVLTHQQGVIGALWVQDMARTLAFACPTVQDVDEPTPELLDEASFWVGQGPVMDLCQREGRPSLAVDGEVSVGLRSPVGTIQIHPESYRVATREVRDRWEVVAAVEYTLWVDWSKVVGVRTVEDARVTVL